MALKIVKQAIFYALVVILWELLVRLKLWPSYLFPAPAQVWESLVAGFRDRTFIVAIAVSLKRIAIGFGISILFGAALGILISKFKLLDETFGGLVLGLQTLPSICWLPLAILWFGLNERAILFVVIMGALFSITIATDAGIKNVSPIFLKAGRNMGARRWRLFRHVILPASMPTVISGLKQGWSFAWRSLMAGELLFVSLGLGHLLMMGRELNDMSQVLAVMIVIAFISIMVDKLVFGRIESDMRMKWGLGNRI